MTGDNHPREANPIEDAIAAILARLICEHSHGSRPPRTRPCRNHYSHGQWLGYVLAGHVPDVQLAIVGVNVDTLHAAVAAAREGERDGAPAADAGDRPDDREDQP